MILDTIRSLFTRQAGTSASMASGDVEPDPVQVAACALLLELAHADGEFSPQEQRHVEEALARHFGLDASATQELLASAAAERGESIDHFSFTRVINQQFDLSQKMVLAEVMWGVILADGKIQEHEAYLVRKLANLLNLAPAYLSQARQAAKTRTEA
jgi:uncharacterized tellurite resistance protein B-like protein